MIRRLQLLRNVGQFDNVAAGATIPLARLSLIYAENGRGKTTLSAVFRSLGSGDPIPITERHRLAATQAPHVVLDCAGGPPPATFQNGAWSRTLPEMVIFDDVFVDQNVCSGLAVDPAHRQNLHELILGAQGVALNRKLHQLVELIERHNSVLRARADAIPATARGNLAVDQFCEFQPRADIDVAIQEAQRNLAAVRAQDSIRNTALFDSISLPAIDADAIDALLRREVAGLDASAVDRVRRHFANIGDGGEQWIADGMGRVEAAHSCPFCAQALATSAVFAQYRAYFSAGYSGLLRSVSGMLAAFNRQHAGDIPSAFERAVRLASERRTFWAQFCDVPDFAVDTAEIARAWRAAREAVVAALEAKQASPLDQQCLSQEARAAIAAYEQHRRQIKELSNRLIATNASIRLAREQAAAGNAASIAADLTRLNAIKARHVPEIDALCAAYLTEKAAKAATEQQRNQTRAQVEHYRRNAFPAYQTAVNLYLQRFNAGFRLDSVAAANTRAGPACNYCVVINNTPVAVGANQPGGGAPSFRNTLSSGDRNTLALAFFFACLDQDPNLTSKVVVIDDPITSLDDHRSLTTTQEIRRLADRVSQLIVLSHSKPFLCRVWEGAPPAIRTALEVARDPTGSTIRLWDVTQDCITEHDRRHAMLRDYLRAPAANSRETARALRPTLEAYLRVACPEHFPPGTLLGHFRNTCDQRVGAPNEILDQQRTIELRNLIEYANRFHHDTNAAWETEAISDGELLNFVQRTLAFTKC